MSDLFYSAGPRRKQSATTNTVKKKRGFGKNEVHGSGRSKLGQYEISGSGKIMHGYIPRSKRIKDLKECCLSEQNTTCKFWGNPLYQAKKRHLNDKK